MPSLIGNYNITPTNTSSVNTDSIATITALSTSVASATNDLLLPALDAKAPKHSPYFTGNVQGVTANMVTATKADNSSSNVQTEINALRTLVNEKADSNNPSFTGTVSGLTAQSITSNGLPGFGPRNVQQDIDALRTADSLLNTWVTSKADTTTVTALSNTVATKADTSTVTTLSNTVTALSNTVSGKADKTDTVLTGDVVVNPKPNEGLETTLAINSTKTNGNNYSTLYLNNASGNAKVWYNNDLGMALTTTTLPIRLSPGNKEALTIDNDRTIELSGSIKSALRLSNNYPQGVSTVTIENKANNGYAKLDLRVPFNGAYLQSGGGLGLLISSESQTPIRLSPNQVEAVLLEANGKTWFRKDVQADALSTNQNIWLQKIWALRPDNIALTYPLGRAFVSKPRNYWMKIPVWKAGNYPTKGMELHPDGSWFNTSDEEFIIRKEGVYHLKAQVTINFTTYNSNNWTGSVHLAFVTRPIGGNIDGRDDIFLYREKFNHFDYLPEDTFTIEETELLYYGTRVWLEVYPQFPENNPFKYTFLRIEPGSNMRLFLIN